MTTSEIRPESQQLLVGGLVIEMRWQSHTFAHATGERYEVSKAHRPTAAQEPGPLVGEAASEAEALRKVIGEWEAELFWWVDRCEQLRSENRLEKIPSAAHEAAVAATTLKRKRRELAALTEQMAHRTLPSPTNE